MPPLLTYVARVSDGLPFVASFAPTQDNVEEQKKQSKDILRGLNSTGRYGWADTLLFYFLLELSNYCALYIK